MPVSGRVGRGADLGRGDAGVPEPTPSRAALSLRSIRLPKWAPAAAGAAALVLGTTAFALGRCSAPDETPVAYAHSGLSSLLLLARGAPAAAASAAARPCLMSRAPARWAPSATTRVPTEITASSSGLFAVGFARGEKQAGGLTVSPATGVVEDVFKPAASEDAVARVVPYEDGGKLVFGVSLAKQGGLTNGVQVAASPPLLLGFTEAAVASVPVIEGEPHGDPASLWLLDRSSGTPNALRAAVAPARGIAVAYRTGVGKDPSPWQIWYGWVGADGTVGVEAKPVGSALNVGMPVVAHNGVDVSLVYADKQEEQGRSRVLWAHGPIGQPLGAPEPFTPPPGGPGGDAIAPSIAGLGDGRWALLWTEGSEGARVLRAQTFDRNYQPLGDALRVSPGTGNFGQGSVGVVNEAAAVAFLLKAGDAYELWGTMLQCR
ncbi:MAG: hypothetical protein HY908_00005 [Myxococcales bacterium]|nr:hypothetical protein [Myxococcales bacterium]